LAVGVEGLKVNMVMESKPLKISTTNFQQSFMAFIATSMEVFKQFYDSWLNIFLFWDDLAWNDPICSAKL